MFLFINSGSHIGLRSALVWLIHVGDKMMWAASFNFLSLQNRSLSIILTSFHSGVWSLLARQVCSASFDFCVSPLLTAFLCSSILTTNKEAVSPKNSSLISSPLQKIYPPPPLVFQKNKPRLSHSNTSPPSPLPFFSPLLLLTPPSKGH